MYAIRLLNTAEINKSLTKNIPDSELAIYRQHYPRKIRFWDLRQTLKNTREAVKTLLDSLGLCGFPKIIVKFALERQNQILTVKFHFLLKIKNK